ncbi:hypothetical protein Q0Z83_049680 [Actinoplanes sichuanensis]|uniref:GNAT family N-acetyltransferase n=1 Tax=Actinoplanes sichuanensis TaxID=512349 RepID=A0ABW4AMZ9_9ACTN|nr:GNAT family N-acetyltransferase [Actinoplanes sichuanensis]BEL06777.1 hypothetical protein Q0Z83_049680 [Actinoplanes sichuanensis]
MTTVVPVTVTDPTFEQVAALFDDYRAHYGRAPSPTATRAWLQDQLADRRISAAAAVRAGRVGGFITALVTPASLMLGSVWSIRDLYVAPEHRRIGIASTLLEHVVDSARAAGALRVSLQTETVNTPALRLYTDFGFRPVTGLELLNLPLDPRRPEATG